jgi:Family of unknown function (DUF5360)
MSSGLKVFLKVADLGMLTYWLLAAVLCAGLIAVPSGVMYEGYGTRLVDAWNWSFAPLDIAFAVAGLSALRMAARGDERWQQLTLVSLVLTMCAGGMAISYWALLGDFQITWWIPNLALLLLPLVWMPQFFRKTDQ